MSGAGHTVGDPFAPGGDVGRDLREVDWAATPLGPPETWTPSLASMVRTVLSSRFSMWMAWGPELTFFCNEAYRRDTLGAKYPWALGRPASEVWAEIWPDIGPRIASVMDTGEATWDESLLLFLQRSGYTEESYHTFSYSPLTDDDGRVAGMLCVVTEETERIIGELRLRTLGDLATTLSSARDEAEVVEATRAALAGDSRSLPFTVGLLVGEDGAAEVAWTTGFAPGQAVPPPSAWPLEEALAGRTVIVDDLLGRIGPLPTGAFDLPPERALVVPLAPGPEGAVGVLAAGLNRHRPYDTAYDAWVELVAGQVAAALGRARTSAADRRRAKELAELDRAKTAFFTNVSHELRTPLTLLLAPAEDALADAESPLPEVQRHRLELIERNGRRLLSLVNTLLDFSRLQSGGADPRFEPVDLPAITADLASMFGSAVERAGLTLEVDCAPLPWPVHVDPDMWAKVVLNLLSNALKFTWEGGITIGVTADGDDAVLSVRDTGVGIAPEDAQRLFGRFERVAGARSRSHEGSGIGLALVAELAEVHGGRASVESAPGEGSTFTVRLPSGTSHLPAEAIVAPAETRTAAERRVADFVSEAMRWLADEPDGATGDVGDDDRERARVLVVDDNDDMRGYVAGLLGEHYVVEVAADGAEALERARARVPDLVLTDVMMPVLDGFGLLAALHADPLTTHVPVVMLSARGGEEEAVEGLEAGADDYLVKPFTARELLARVRANLELDRVRRTRDELERARTLLDQAQQLAHLGSWEVDAATGRVTASDELLRIVRMDRATYSSMGWAETVEALIHPDDREDLRERFEETLAGGPALDAEARVVHEDGEERLVRLRGIAIHEDERLVAVRGSIQDVTEQRLAERVMAATQAEREAAAREHRIADELQQSLLPPGSFDPDHLEVAAYYQAGVAGTQVGGDWYDVIELGPGRTALVLGDVMGRGIQAAAIMGQLRTAVRAYARLDLAPADVLQHLDGLVRELGADQIATCVYAVHDARSGTLVYANAGHLPPLLRTPGQPVRRLTGAGGPPLGIGPLELTEEEVTLEHHAFVALYTDGLVERRDAPLDQRIDELAERLTDHDEELADLPQALVRALVPGTPDDDIAILLAFVPDGDAPVPAVGLAAEPASVRQARTFVAEALAAGSAPAETRQSAVLLASELVTNAIRHGRRPIELAVRAAEDHVVLEVSDGAPAEPRPRATTIDDEGGRGLRLVDVLADSWGTTPGADGKCVWAVLRW